MKGFSGFPEGRLPTANGNGQLRMGRTERAVNRTVTPDPAAVASFMSHMQGERPSKGLVKHWHNHYSMGVPMSRLLQISGTRGQKSLLALFKEHGLGVLPDGVWAERYRESQAGSKAHVNYWYELYLRGVPPKEILAVSGRGEMKELLGLFVGQALSLLLPEELEKRRALYRPGEMGEIEIPPPPPAVPGEADRPHGRPPGRKTTAGVEPTAVEVTPTVDSEAIIYPPDMTLSELTRLNDLYLAGEPLASLVKEARLSDPLKLFGLFREYGLPVKGADGQGVQAKKTRRGGPKPALKPDEVRAFHQRYLDGEKAPSLASEAGVGVVTLYGHFNRLGLPMLGKRPKPVIGRVTVVGLHERYLAGEVAVKLAEEVGLTSSRLYALFKDHDLPTKWAMAEAEEVAAVAPAGDEAGDGLAEAQVLELAPAGDVAPELEAETAGEPKPEPDKPLRGLPNVFVQSLYGRYMAGETIEQLAEKTQIAEAQIYAEFEARNLPLKTVSVTTPETGELTTEDKPAPRPRPNMDYPTLLALHKRYLAGESIPEICQEVGIGKTQLYERFRKAGLPTKWATNITPAESEVERLKLADVAERLDRLKMSIEAFGYEVRVTVEIRAYAEVEL